MIDTPLRYPGGKTLMTKFFEEVIQENDLKNVKYVEPYAGGAGAAISLLLKESVESIHINDANLSIYSFWYYLTKSGDEFLSLFDKTPVTLSEWKKQRAIFKEAKEPSLKLGFSAFFLSRCNRSGILHAGPIGGQDPKKQRESRYKIDCRFNKKKLRIKLRKIIELKDKIEVTNYDALKLLTKYRKNFSKETSLIYLDPPYYKQGSSLYMNFYEHKDHEELSIFLKSNSDLNWVLSYDDVSEIQNLYSEIELYRFSLNYTAQNNKKGSELLTCSNAISLPSSMEIKRNTLSIPIKPIKSKESVQLSLF